MPLRNAHQSDIYTLAKKVFGSETDAERWLSHPAIGLNQQRPIDLLSTEAGLQQVEEYLTRIAFGVYT